MKTRFRKWTEATAIVALVMGGVVLKNGEAAAASCPSLEHPRFILQSVTDPQVIYNHSHSQDEVHKMLEAEKGVGEGWKAVGLTRAEFTVKSSAETRLRPQADGTWCAEFVTVTMTAGFTRQVVEIPDRFREGTCEYKAIVDHENEHVATNNKALADHWARLERESQAALSSLGAMALKSRDEVNSVPMALLTERLKPIFAAFSEDQRRRNDHLDVPDNYRAVQSQCQNW